MVLKVAMSARNERYVLVRSAGATWAIAAAGVSEVLPTAPLERPPGSPRALAGFMNLGGRALAVVRLATLFGAPETEGDDLYHHVLRLAVRGEAAPMGLLVERVLDVDARADGMAPLEEGQSVNGAVIGNLIIGDQLTPLLDWGRLLLVEERQRVQELAATVQARLAELHQATS
jgi:purine-binding chemotaxis protein CheW